MTSPRQDEPAGIPSPPLSPFEDENLLVPVIATDERGMIIGNGSPSDPKKEAQAVKRKNAATRRPKRQPIKYVSRHFSMDVAKSGDSTSVDDDDAKVKGKDNAHASATSTTGPATPPRTPAKASSHPRVFYGLNVDDLSSDSDLTDVPSDIGPDPFLLPSTPAIFSQQATARTKTKARNPTKSPFFPSPHKHRPTFLSTLPFPPLSAERFGLMQERLAQDPFRLLIATIFLNKTPGERAMPVFFQLMEKYPTPADLAEAEVADVTAIIHHLGFQNQRARKCVAMAKMWVEREPERGRRYRKLDYPVKRDGRDVKEGEVLDDEDERVGWEISHLPGVGAYGHDSWRMFCRDRLRGVASGWDGEGSEEADFEPEWKRVLPLDKELRAWMTWMWMREGWVWNKETGQRTRASKELMEMAMGGGIVVEEKEKDTLTVKAVSGERVKEDKRDGEIARPAGEILERADLKMKL